MIQNDAARCQTRITTALPLVETGDGLFAILLFFDWLSTPEKDWGKVTNAIDKLKPKIKFYWNWSNITPAIERQDEKTKKTAQHFIEFFEDRIDSFALKEQITRIGKKQYAPQ